MKIRNANLILKRIKEGRYNSANEDPENFAFLKEMKLVKVDNEQVVLTSEGSRAAEMGIEDYLNYHETEQEILNFCPEKCRKNRKVLLLIFFLLFSIFIAAVFTEVSLPAIFERLNLSQTFGRLSLV